MPRLTEVLQWNGCCRQVDLRTRAQKTEWDSENQDKKESLFDFVVAFLIFELALSCQSFAVKQLGFSTHSRWLRSRIVRQYCYHQ